MTIDIKHRHTGETLMKVEAISLIGANLSFAELSVADLSGANLKGANLRGAELSGANLKGANLSFADLSFADLSFADLNGADLSGAYLSVAKIRGANLRSATYKDSFIRTPPISINGLRWPVLIIGEYIIIGCEEHKITEWTEFEDSTIDRMDTAALSFWKENKSKILSFVTSN